MRLARIDGPSRAVKGGSMSDACASGRWHWSAASVRRGTRGALTAIVAGAVIVQAIGCGGSVLVYESTAPDPAPSTDASSDAGTAKPDASDAGSSRQCGCRVPLGPTNLPFCHRRCDGRFTDWVDDCGVVNYVFDCGSGHRCECTPADCSGYVQCT